MEFYYTTDPIYGSEYKTTKSHLMDAHHSEGIASSLFIDYVRYIYNVWFIGARCIKYLLIILQWCIYSMDNEIPFHRWFQPFIGRRHMGHEVPDGVIKLLMSVYVTGFGKTRHLRTKINI